MGRKNKQGNKEAVVIDPNKWVLARDERERQMLLVKGLLKPCDECKRLTHVIHLDLRRLCPDCRPKPKTP